MTKLEMAVAIITALCLLGVILLLSLGKETAILMPVLTALVAWMIATKRELIAKKFLKSKKK